MLEKEYDLPDRVLNDASANTNLAIPQNFQFGVQRIPTFSYFVQTVALNEMGGPPKTVPFAIGPAVLLPGSSANIGACVVTFLVSEDMSNYYEIVKWMREATPYKDFSEVLPFKEVFHEAFLIYYTNKKNPYKKITFRGIFPTELSGLDFTYSDTEAKPLTATVKFITGDYIVENL